ncbi:hypothetical protein RQP46_003144 [Phenoliferia psychrophenolica]
MTRAKKLTRACARPAGFFTASEVLLTTPAVLAKKTNLSPQDVTALILELSLAADEPARSVADCLALTADRDDDLDAPRTPCTITTGDEGIDRLLGGGVRVGSITEFVGESASGKSHICLQLATTAQLPIELGGLQGGTILISSEGTLPSQRLLALAESLAARLPPSSSPASTWTPHDMMDNIHTAQAPDMETLAAVLSYYIPAHIEAIASHATLGTLLPSSDAFPLSPSSTPLSQPNFDSTEPLPPRSPPKPPLPIRLLIIDSIAAPIRGAHESDSAGFISRSKDLNGVSDSLKRLAHVYGCAVVVVNQVSAVFSRDPSSLAGNPAHESYHLPERLYNRYQAEHFSGEKHGNAAALGHSWTNTINARVRLARTFGRTSGEAGVRDGTRVREATMVFSPWAPRGTVRFVLDEEGVRSLEGQEDAVKWDEVD